MAQWIIRQIKDVDAVTVERSTGATIQVLLGGEQGMPNFHTRCFTLAPDGMIPAHRHATIEHEQVVLEGEMVLVLDGKERSVGVGDCIYIPAGVGHAYHNRTDAPVRFLCMVPVTERYETEWLEMGEAADTP